MKKILGYRLVKTTNFGTFSLRFYSEKSYSKGVEVGYFSRAIIQKFLHWPTMVTNTFQDFESPWEKFIAAALNNAS